MKKTAEKKTKTATKESRATDDVQASSTPFPSTGPSLVRDKVASATPLFKEKFGDTNALSVPRLVKVVINAGTGSGVKRDRNRNDMVMDRIAKITGQKPGIRGAKKSIASFKTRSGDPIGVMVTLRGFRMYTFLDKLVHIALPRTKDFRGLNRSTVNELGNMTIGIREHTIFPETSDEDIKDVFGMAITIVTTAKSRERGLTFFEYLGFPLKKEGEDEKKSKKTRKK